MAIGESEPAAISMSHFGAGMRSVVGFNFEFARQKAGGLVDEAPRSFSKRPRVSE
jgi:hypothetical protein